MAVSFAFHRPLPHSGLLRLRDLDAVTSSLLDDGLAVLPTETGYMLAGLATSATALERVFEAKGRDEAQVMHVACASLSMIAGFGRLDAVAAALLAEFTPGPLSVVIEKLPSVPDRLISVNGTVGIRVPDHPATLQVVAAAGTGLTATSLNRSGSAPVEVDPDRPDALRELDWPDGVVHVVVDAGARRYPLPSTLVRTTGAAPEVLRAGVIDEAQIRSVLGRPS